MATSQVLSISFTPHYSVVFDQLLKLGDDVVAETYRKIFDWALYRNGKLIEISEYVFLKWHEADRTGDFGKDFARLLDLATAVNNFKINLGDPLDAMIADIVERISFLALDPIFQQIKIIEMDKSAPVSLNGDVPFPYLDKATRDALDEKCGEGKWRASYGDRHVSKVTIGNDHSFPTYRITTIIQNPLQDIVDNAVEAAKNV